MVTNYGNVITRKRRRYAPEDPAVIRRLLILSIPFLWFLGEAVFDLRLGSVMLLLRVLASNVPLVSLAALSTTLGLFLFYRYRRQHRLLTILDINERGLSIGRLADRAASSVEYLVSWKEISSVEEKIQKDAGGQSQGWISINSTLDVSFEMTRSNAFRWLPRESLIDGLIKWAPQAELKLSDHSATPGGQQLRYTGLWLENLDAGGKRQRLKALQSGDNLQEGKFKIVRQLGQGGQGRAYLATVNDATLTDIDSEHHERLVVLKEYILPVLTTEDPQTIKEDYFTTEAKVLAMLNHPNIVKLYDCFQEDYRGYLIMEFIRGESLRDMVTRKGTFSELQALPIALSLCDALCYMHNFQPPLLHGDISPENVMIDDLGRPKLIDFTVAHQFRDERQSILFGKPGFLAPEQYRGYNLPQSEIYALGATIFYLISGIDPEPMEAVTLHDKGVAVSDQLNSIIARAMALDISHRYRQAADFLNDLVALT